MVTRLLTFFVTIFVFALPEQNLLGDQPNIIIILADDMGYGDTQPFNPKSKIPTPSFNRLAKEGLVFTDAHSGSGVCTPTRYGLICGRYAWRTTLKRGVLGGYSKPLISTKQQTIGGVLKAVGYETACIGKWHLGLGWQWRGTAPDNINFFGIAGNANSVDYEQPITDGPTSHGFDYSYIIPASLDMSPYVFIENDRVTARPDRVIPGVKFPSFYRKGEIAPDFDIMKCLGHLADKAVDYIDKKSKTNTPYFLYLPLPAPHKPVIPTPKFQGKSNLGPYGDFVMQVDDVLSRLLKAVDDSEAADNTLIIFTSDNGSFMRRNEEQDFLDHVSDTSIQSFHASNHKANGPLRGTKADIWEAGHRVPFFARWTQSGLKGKRVDKTICLVDLLATVAEISGASFSRDEDLGSQDSFSFAFELTTDDAAKERPAPVIHHSSGGTYAIRQGKWKLVLGNGSGGRAKPKGKPFAKPYHLYNISSDIAETENLADKYPELVERLTQQFWDIAGDDPPQANQRSSKSREKRKAG